MRTLVRVLLYDVVVATIHIIVDAYLIYSYFDAGDTWWAAATITAVCLPGLLGKYGHKYLALGWKILG